MEKNWGSIKAQILNLGFENAEAFEENKSRFYEAVNRAANIIALTVAPNIEAYEIPKEEFKNRVLFNIKDEVLGFADYLTPACTLTKSGEPCGCGILPDKRIYLEASEDVTVWYKRLPEAISENTSLNDKVDLTDKGALLLPLLACFYIWQEDDERKAFTYRNDYEALKKELFDVRGKAYIKAGAVL